ncbi:YbiA [Stenotrophomonas phage vB_SmaS-AXL_1]|uniref:YbiA n=1 Tax=Stenotrophomonas phage vB_SmaS-AXL_1 TaxID=2909581 RepID=UPI00240A8AD6|nr:YbiA [Stenotrophomonas phage vB_SmaS-AXL_1]UIS24762.1 YbiA [Stenotrophomonas phage vB_SmaS-AXL_1]
MKDQYVRYTLFYGGVFSQWYPSPMVIDGVEYGCAEQYMMAQKARVFGDEQALDEIMATSNPAEQKAIGRRVKGFDRRQWDSVSRDVVMRASLAKFTSDPKLRAQLLLTEGTLLVEASPTDVIWGIGLDERDPRCHDPSEWRGTNWLGQVLTDLRENLAVLP